jgi:hypothetical protein
MFAVEWLKQGVTVEREALANLADAVATARARVLWRAILAAFCKSTRRWVDLES